MHKESKSVQKIRSLQSREYYSGGKKKNKNEGTKEKEVEKRSGEEETREAKRRREKESREDN